MRRLILGATVLAGLVGATPAAALTNGTPDGGGHPNVGGLVSPTQYSDGTWIYCSGTLISPAVFLTAAHCADDGQAVGVSLASTSTAGERVYFGTFLSEYVVLP